MKEALAIPKILPNMLQNFECCTQIASMTFDNLSLFIYTSTWKRNVLFWTLSSTTGIRFNKAGFPLYLVMKGGSLWEQ
jgi:hypothetical protein